MQTSMFVGRQGALAGASQPLPSWFVCSGVGKSAVATAKPNPLEETIEVPMDPASSWDSHAAPWWCVTQQYRRWTELD